MEEQRSVRLIEALAAVWGAIRRNHPDVPGVVLLPAPSLTRKLNVLGHFAPVRWHTREHGGELLHEVIVVAEHLDRAAADIVETLLHEAAHAMSHARGIKDCSATSQYHNRKFKAAAEELGLLVSQVANYGFALTMLPSDTAQRYQEFIDGLEKVLVVRRKPLLRPITPPSTGSANVDQEGKPTRPRSRNLKATCPCGFIIRASRKTMELTSIRCESCDELFSLC